MKRVLFHKNWKLDLSNTLLCKVMNNSYFSDNFFAVLTYPFDIIIEEKNAQFIYHYNQSNFQKVYDKLVLQEDGKLEECKLIILESEGKRKSAQLVIGFDNFPNFDKKLSELPLHNFDLQETIYDHAKSLVSKTYPDTDYNFPAVHTDLINKDNYLFAHFKGTYNLYKNGDFVKNVLDSDGRVQNYNLIEPAIYYLYLLKIAFADAGYTLKGDILEDEILKKVCLFKGNTYSESKYPSPVEWIVDKQSSDNIQNTFYKDQQEISFNGTFRIKGTAYIRGWNSQKISDLSTGRIIWESISMNNTEPIDVTINTTKDTILEYYGIDGVSGMSNNKIADITVSPISIIDDDGNIYNPTLNNSTIDLTKYVPDMTVGELIKAAKNTFNLDLDVDNKTIYMNKIESEMKNFSNILDFRQFQISDPKIKFNEELSFLLRYQFENDEFPFQELFIDKTGKRENFQKLESTQEIASPIIPLPLIIKNNLNSAKALSDSDRNLQIILYSGLKNGKNETETNKPLLWTNLYEKYWKEWLSFRINSDTFIWKFNAKKADLSNLKVKSKIYAYNRMHIIKKISINDLSDSLYEVEIETASE